MVIFTYYTYRGGQLKKVLFLLFLSLVLVACGNTKEDPEAEAESDVESAAAEKEDETVEKENNQEVITNEDLDNVLESFQDKTSLTVSHNADYSRIVIESESSPDVADEIEQLSNEILEDIGEGHTIVVINPQDKYELFFSIKDGEVMKDFMRENENVEKEKVAEEDETEDVEQAKPSSEEEILYSLVELIDEGSAFDTGSYVPGDIPEGEYAFVTFEGAGNYYSEKEQNGNIIDNENFDSFGYVYVHEVGNIETKGVLVSIDALEDLGVSGAKELYEILNNQENYTEAGWYKIGKDLEPGEYVIESYGEGYVAVMGGPVGNSSIVTNEIFNGRFSVNVQEGQYLKISRGTITE